MGSTASDAVIGQAMLSNMSNGVWLTNSAGQSLMVITQSSITTASAIISGVVENGTEVVLHVIDNNGRESTVHIVVQNGGNPNETKKHTQKK